MLVWRSTSMGCLGACSELVHRVKPLLGGGPDKQAGGCFIARLAELQKVSAGAENACSSLEGIKQELDDKALIKGGKILEWQSLAHVRQSPSRQKLIPLKTTWKGCLHGHGIRPQDALHAWAAVIIQHKMCSLDADSVHAAVDTHKSVQWTLTEEPGAP